MVCLAALDTRLASLRRAAARRWEATTLSASQRRRATTFNACRAPTCAGQQPVLLDGRSTLGNLDGSWAGRTRRVGLLEIGLPLLTCWRDQSGENQSQRRRNAAPSLLQDLLEGNKA